MSHHFPRPPFDLQKPALSVSRTGSTFASPSLQPPPPLSPSSLPAEPIRRPHSRLRNAARSERSASFQNPKSKIQNPPSAFTLVELLVVIAIIAVLSGLAFPVISGVMERAKKVQAKNDAVQIVTAVNAFYTEYGQYPCAANSSDDTSDYTPANATAQSTLMNELRAKAGTLNTRQIAFLSPANAKDSANPRAGLGGDGAFYDPWGSRYGIKIDSNYNNVVKNPYTADSGAGPDDLNNGAIVWSLGKNGAIGGGAAAGQQFSKEPGSPTKYASSGDVISWQ